MSGINLSVKRKERLGITGPSGSGKSTLAKTIVGLNPVFEGSIEFLGRDLSEWMANDSQNFYRQVQYIFQDSNGALSPRKNISFLLEEVLKYHQPDMSKPERSERIYKSMDILGLPKSLLYSYPGQLSGGEKQRINIGRALLLEPRVLICDEITSALDIESQHQIIDLLCRVNEEMGTTIILISHDNQLLSHFSNRIVKL